MNIKLTLATIGGFLIIAGSLGVFRSIAAGELTQPTEMMSKITVLIGIVLFTAGLFIPWGEKN